MKNIGRYEIIEEVGRGGMAVVYKAYDPNLDRYVAIKLIRKEAIPPEQLAHLLKRFDREAKAQGKFEHPNIVSVYDYGEYEGAPFLVMAYHSRGTLKDYVKGPIPYTKAAAMLSKVANALAYAQEEKVLHRDVKPGNIMMGEDDTPLLTDFGIAKLLEGGGETLTRTGAGMGTPTYMAPEQWTGDVCPQTDMYSLGVIFYELVTGRRPYTADTPGEFAILQATEPIPKPITLVPDLPPKVEEVLLTALEYDPENRYESMREFAGILEKLARGEMDTIPAKTKTSASEQSGTTEDMQDLPTYNQLEPPQTPPPEPSKKKPIWLWIGGSLGAIVLCTLIVVLALQVSNLLDGYSSAMGNNPQQSSQTAENSSDNNNAAAASSDDTAGGSNSLQPEEPTPTEIDEASALADDAGAAAAADDDAAASDDDTQTTDGTPISTPTITPARPVVSEPMLVYAYGPYDETEIYIYYLNSGTTQRITNNSYEDKAPSFSWDNTRIVYHSYRQYGWELYIYDLRTGEETQLTNFDGEAKFPNWSPVPGDERIVFEGRQGQYGAFDINAFMINSDGSGFKQITFSNADNRPIFSTDGQKIIFGRATADDTGDGNITASDYLDIFTLNLETGSLRQVTDTAHRDEFQFCSSPDSEYIFYIASYQDTDESGILNLDDNRNLHIIDMNGGNYQMIDMPDYPIYSPGWSADGRYLSFTIWFESDVSAIWLYDLQTEKVIELTGEGSYYHPEWNN